VSVRGSLCPSVAPYMNFDNTDLNRFLLNHQFGIRSGPVVRDFESRNAAHLRGGTPVAQHES